jgi:Heavy metal associated domain 2
MLDLALHDIPQTAELAECTTPYRRNRKLAAAQPKLVLRSRVAGRERWHVDILEDNPRLAAAVELVLRTEEGIEEVRANPLTGRVLVHYQPRSIVESVQTLLSRAIDAGPMTLEEFAALQSKQPQGSLSKHLLTTEIACSLSHLVLFGGFCPLGLAATGVLLLLHQRSAHTHG